MSREHIALKCPQCGSECRWLDDVSTKVCLHCGYQEKVADSDAVRKAQIAADKELEKIKLEHEHEKQQSKNFNMEMLGLLAIVFVGFLFLVLLEWLIGLLGLG